MKISIILGHPQKGSFNHAIAEIVWETLHRNGHETFFHDLYDERFDPLITGAEISDGAELDAAIQRHCGEIAQANGIVLVHPNWWGQPPAILKGWVDRVLRPGIAYRFLEGDGGEGIPIGLLRAQSALVFNTANTPEERENQVFGDPLENLWKTCIFDLCGVKDFYRKMYRVVVTSSTEERQSWLADVRTTVNAHYPPCAKQAEK